jgi:DNA-binding response OmpR family regulator
VKEGRVLVVDDEPMVRDTLGQVLIDEGYVVDLAVDGASALERVRAAKPNVILLDLMMPGMNGRQFLQQLRNNPDYTTIPVLIMTAVHGMSVNLATLRASEVVEKPFNIDDLLNKVALSVYRSRDADKGMADRLPTIPPPVVSTPETKERGVVLVIEHDRARLHQLDLELSERGYTVVSMTRALVQLARLARALRPRAILLDLVSEGVHEVARELRGELHQIALLVFTRDAANGAAVRSEIDTLENAVDADLVAFVERQR